MFLLKILWIIVLIIFIFIFHFYPISVESFENVNNIDFYVISLKHKDRLENIKNQQKKINKEIILFDAVKGDKIDIDNMISNGFISNDWVKNATPIRKREIACYLSHLNLYKQIQQIGHYGYTIIFEDDFDIMRENFLEYINETIEKINSKNIDFDMLYFGNTHSNHGKHIVDDIYYMNTMDTLYGMHAYLINNKKIKNIIDMVNIVDTPIDVKIEDLGKLNKLTILVVYPTIVNVINSNSNINDLSIETFTNVYK